MRYFFGALTLLTLAGCGGPAADPPRSAAPTYTADEMASRKSHCEDSMRDGERAGFLQRQGALRINVDENAWDALTWRQKEISLTCLAVIDANGGDPGGRIVSAWGLHSGKQLASGSPGAGTLAPD